MSGISGFRQNHLQNAGANRNSNAQAASNASSASGTSGTSGTSGASGTTGNNNVREISGATACKITGIPAECQTMIVNANDVGDFSCAEQALTAAQNSLKGAEVGKSAVAYYTETKFEYDPETKGDKTYERKVAIVVEVTGYSCAGMIQNMSSTSMASPWVYNGTVVISQEFPV